MRCYRKSPLDYNKTLSLMSPQEDIFFITSPPLGEVVREVEIEHDNSGAAPGWHCEQVVVVDETSGKRFTFPCDRCGTGAC
jgi:hypothetical protein